MTPSSPSLVVKVAPRRLRIAALTVLAIGAIVAGTILFHRGVELQRIDARTTSTSSQTQLLDDYNAYSGFVAAAFGSPLETFVAMAVQVVVLRLFATQLTRSEPAWHVGIVALTVAAGVGYLIGNSFNALNVQLQPLRNVGLAIAPTDLASTVDSSLASSTVTRSIPETSATAQGNAVVNTMLRNLVLQQVPLATSLCSDSNTANADGDVVDHFLKSGLPQRDWFRRVLPYAAPTKALRLAVDAVTSHSNVNANELPMNASLAADLVLYAMLYGRWYFPWGDQHSLRNDTEIFQRYPQLKAIQNSTDVVSLRGSMAEITGLLPPQSTSDSDAVTTETAQRETLLRESVAMARREFSFAKQTKQSGRSLTFAHVDISSSIRFDAVTLEFEMDPMGLATAMTQDNTTRFTNLDQYFHCGPWPGLCLVDKVAFPGLKSSLREMPAQVKALSPCVDAQGIERMTMELNSTSRAVRVKPLCPQTSNSSLLILSYGKRLVAEAITQSTVRNASGAFGDPWSTVNKTAAITNLRKIYTFTVGRLSWNLEDLAASNHAQCMADDGNCFGLQLALSPEANASTDGKQPRLVVGATALPLDRLSPMGFEFDQRPKFVDLVEIYEPEKLANEPALGGDPLLVHNIGTITWNATLPSPADEPSPCYSRVEDRLRLIVNNHYYSEHSLQSAYTAATWFLFQNAVVKQTVVMPDGRETLDFAANVQRVAVWISTPQTSAFLTLAGCFILAVGLLVSVGKSYCQGLNHPLSTITDPHVIARVLVDDEQFPPRLLKRRVVEENGTRTRVEERVVTSLSLRPVDDKENQGKQPWRSG